ncbi:MAG: class A beta-lactamase-related serine hydrolase [Runella slithyformis]|nr:MAG: class A beta-lactamase-related serine hydrolase [Runella slithyformis]TAE99532.1 MAG: class A beta-lactamase-related serine hydrolase [Runella slithyformis]TAF27118.1 MAG: class A beta-lactamase-related serine hydrolase [Runella slithyformis]TAF45543.1 MAG: class A beta-lactamase-related serine hydrolase [Runella slithyformis]
MKKITFLLFYFSLFTFHFALSQSLVPAKTPEEVGFSSERLKKLDDLMQGFVNDGIVPNAVTYVARKGKIIHHKAFGYSNLERKTPLKKDDIFRIASQSKAITTVALMTLYEEGKFLLEEPVSKYIPAFKNPRVLENYDKNTLMFTTRAAKREINIHDLLTHTAGIPYEHPLENRPEFKVPYFNSVENDVLADVVNKIAARPLLSDPGEKYVYGLNSDVVGRLVEVLSGMPLDQFLKTRVLDPIGMNDTHFYLPEIKNNRLVELYSKGKTEEKLTLHTNNAYRQYAVSGPKTYFSGGAGLLSTIEDYAKFCQMLLNGGTFNGRRILGRKTVELMGRNHIRDLNVWDRNDKFGLGLQVITEGSRYGDQATPGALTWGGMYCSEYTIDAKEELIMLVFTNIHPFAHYSDVVRKFRIVTYQALN